MVEICYRRLVMQVSIGGKTGWTRRVNLVNLSFGGGGEVGFPTLQVGFRRVDGGAGVGWPTLPSLQVSRKFAK